METNKIYPIAGKTQCPKCGGFTLDLVWMATIPQRCSCCGYTVEQWKVIC